MDTNHIFISGQIRTKGSPQAYDSLLKSMKVCCHAKSFIQQTLAVALEPADRDVNTSNFKALKRQRSLLD